jgi:cellulose biosynthesis protein BcsQ
MKTFALYNLKGGVGKTAAAVNLAYLSSRDGYRTLLWDLDPQGASTFYFRIEPESGDADRYLRKRRRALRAIKGTDYERLDLLPADVSARHADLQLDAADKPKSRLRRILRLFEPDYDYVFMDSPPSISLLSENIFCAADVLLIPLIPTALSLRAYDQVSSFLQICDGARADRRPFFSMVDRRRRLHRELVTSFVAAHPEVLRTYIPYAAEIEKMGVHRAPVARFAGTTGPAQAFEALWSNVRALG